MKSNYNIFQFFVLVIFLISIVLNLSSCKIIKMKSDWEVLNLKGKIKTLNEFSFVAVDSSDSIEKGERVMFLIFSNKGNKIEDNQYCYYDSSQDYKGTYKYDDKENRIEENFYRSGSLSCKAISKYDDKRNRIEYNHFLPDGSLVSKDTSNYDDKGNRVEYRYSQGNKAVLKYDDKGNEIEESRYLSDSSYKAISKYYDKGKKIELNCSQSYSNLIWKVISKYDDKGNRIEYSSFNSDGSQEQKRTFKYDDKGNKIEISSFVYDGNQQSQNYKRTYKYDDKGNEIEIEYNTYYPEDSLVYKYTDKYKYDFDSKGNWIKKIKFENEVPTLKVVREIEYFQKKRRHK